MCLNLENVLYIFFKNIKIFRKKLDNFHKIDRLYLIDKLVNSK